jgi:hypothetical protein
LSPLVGVSLGTAGAFCENPYLQKAQLLVGVNFCENFVRHGGIDDLFFSWAAHGEYKKAAVMIAWMCAFALFVATLFHE